MAQYDVCAYKPLFSLGANIRQSYPKFIDAHKYSPLVADVRSLSFRKVARTNPPNKIKLEEC